ncbi:hypothetical protein Pelo_16389 [Pelomyxa schiedti]|nr:hypothetical protein Pelo_16389 [Pelomyxa schiedti]
MATKTCNHPRVGPWEWFLAVDDGDTEAMRRMLAGDPSLVHSVNDRRQMVTALHAAAWGGKERCVDLLLSMKINVGSQIVRKFLYMFALHSHIHLK